MLFFPALDMPNVCGLIAPDGILSDICCLVSDSLEGAANEDEIQVTGNRLRVCSGTAYELLSNFGRQSVQFLVPEFEPLRKRGIAFGKSPYAVVKNPQRQVIGWLKQGDLANQRPVVQTLRSSADRDRVVGDSF